MGDIGRRQTRFEVLPVAAPTRPVLDDVETVDVVRTHELVHEREHPGAWTEPARS